MKGNIDMARKRNQSPLDGLIELASLLPSWLSVVLAFVSYLILSTLASKPVAVPSVAPGQIGGLLTVSLMRALVQVGQYALPLILLAGAGISFFRARKSTHLMDVATGSNAAQAIAGMSWREFELLVAEGFRRRGFAVKDMGGQGPDGGVDVVLLKGTERYLVQCKQWRATKVSVAVVRELYGVMSAEGAAGGFVVTSGSFTEDAESFASGRNIKLVAGAELCQLLAKGKQVIAPATIPMAEDRPQRLSPACPRCGSEMKVREAKKGPAAGNKFYGCSKYPACRGTLPL